MYRKITVATKPIAKPDAVAVVLFEGTRQPPVGYSDVNLQFEGTLAQAIGRDEVTASLGSVVTLYPPHGPHRLLIAGLGKLERFEGNALRIAAAKIAQAAFAARIERLAIHVLPTLADHLDPAVIGSAIGDGLAIANFSFDTFKGAARTNGNGNSKAAASKLDLTVDVETDLRSAVQRSLTVGQAVTTARTLAATPPNVANPRYLADYCKKLARKVGLTCSVIDAKRAKELGMGGLLAVGGGSNTPPAMICLQWKPASKNKGKTRAKNASPILLVGKAVTFDTGGYSLKPDGGKNMKYDKCGGMAVIGAMEAIARLKLPVPVVGVIPCAENMVDKSAYRPDDIITFCNGVTAEVTNTDAEGRLILADALAYGTKTYKPRAVVDLATLTGGVVVALGSACAGYFCNDDALRDQLAAAANQTGEKLWQLPLWNEHRDQMKGTHGDLVNSADRKAHPIQGAAFLSYFVGSDAPQKLPTLPWAHIDIAGMSNVDSDTPLYPKGPTAFGVRLLTQLVENIK